MSEESEIPYAVLESRLYYDTLGRTVARAIVLTGQVPEDFIEFEIHAKVKIKQPLPGADGSTAFTEREFPVAVPVPGVRAKRDDKLTEALAKVFGQYDDLVEAEQKKMQEQVDEHMKMIAAQQKAIEEQRQSQIETPVHNPELPERHLDKDGNEISAPGGIIKP